MLALNLSVHHFALWDPGFMSQSSYNNNCAHGDVLDTLRAKYSCAQTTNSYITWLSGQTEHIYSIVPSTSMGLYEAQASTNSSMHWQPQESWPQHFTPTHLRETATKIRFLLYLPRSLSCTCFIHPPINGGWYISCLAQIRANRIWSLYTSASPAVSIPLEPRTFISYAI